MGGLPLIAYTVTPTHFGVGRSPGIVDLPIERDPMGYPVMPSSGVKGALKNLCARKEKCEIISSGKLEGRIKCKGGNGAVCRCCCFFGPEPGEGEKGAAALRILDFILFAMPVPSSTHGWVYVTSPYLLRSVLSLAQALDEGVGAAHELSETVSALLEAYEGGCGGGAEADSVFLGTHLPGGEVRVPGTVLRPRRCGVGERGEKLAELFGDHPLSRVLGERLLIVGDDLAKIVLEKGLIRRTRVRLDYRTKTASSKMLWTEEYLPQGTVFVGGIIESGWVNDYCKEPGAGGVLTEFKQVMFNGCGGCNRASTYMVVGGKESIGKGLVKLVITG